MTSVARVAGKGPGSPLFSRFLRHSRSSYIRPVPSRSPCRSATLHAFGSREWTVRGMNREPEVTEGGSVRNSPRSHGSFPWASPVGYSRVPPSVTLRSFASRDVSDRHEGPGFTHFGLLRVPHSSSPGHFVTPLHGRLARPSLRSPSPPLTPPSFHRWPLRPSVSTSRFAHRSSCRGFLRTS